MSHFPSYTSICYVNIVYPSRPCKRYDTHFHFIHTSVALRTYENYEDYKNVSSTRLRVRSVAHRFFSYPREHAISLYKKKELHINLRIVDWTIPPSIASPGICKIIGHYPDPKSRGAVPAIAYPRHSSNAVAS